MVKIPTEAEENLAIQDTIRSRANTSLGVIEKAFIRNGSGRYVVLRSSDPELSKRLEHLRNAVHGEVVERESKSN